MSRTCEGTAILIVDDHAPKLNGGVRYLSTPRHALEVEHYSYRRRLRKLSAKLG